MIQLDSGMYSGLSDPTLVHGFSTISSLAQMADSFQSQLTKNAATTRAISPTIRS